MALLTECRQNLGGSGYKHCTPSGVQQAHTNLPDQNYDRTSPSGYRAQTINTSVRGPFMGLSKLGIAISLVIYLQWFGEF
jgi:hypothetical protein